MRTRWMMVSIGLCVIGTIYGINSWMSQSSNADAIKEWRSWRPNSNDIVRAVNSSGASGTDIRSKREKFAILFQQRYRNHLYPVRLKFLPSGKLMIMFAPTVTRWEMTDIALEARKEAQQVFGQYFDIDMYETYIMYKHVFIGTVRSIPGEIRAKVEYFTLPH